MGRVRPGTDMDAGTDLIMKVGLGTSTGQGTPAAATLPYQKKPGKEEDEIDFQAF